VLFLHRKVDNLREREREKKGTRNSAPLGIIGLGVVVTHRQKRKRQLKDLLRAKNLGPILESREIAQNTGTFFH
jgi:hypothetical protein